MPLFYEILPILCVYLHHVKNFREKSIVQQSEVTATASTDNLLSAATDEKESLIFEQNQLNPLYRSANQARAIKKPRRDNRLLIGRDLHDFTQEHN